MLFVVVVEDAPIPGSSLIIIGGSSNVDNSSLAMQPPQCCITVDGASRHFKTSNQLKLIEECNVAYAMSVA